MDSSFIPAQPRASGKMPLFLSEVSRVAGPCDKFPWWDKKGHNGN